MPRMKIAAVALLAETGTELLNFTLGVKSPICVTLSRPRAAMPSPETAEIAIGVSCSDSARRRAVTVISSMPALSSAAACAGASCAWSAGAPTSIAESDAPASRHLPKAARIWAARPKPYWVIIASPLTLIGGTAGRIGPVFGLQPFVSAAWHSWRLNAP